ncbi:MAG TPA: hypothetical protein VLG92_02325 [Candidatus Saccharimonadia bacterium]|nr:hypothetical protein [Candidatus Saccharimonadia bacterium]
MSQAKTPTFVFPPALVTRADLARLVREVEAIDNEFEAQKARNHTSGKTGYRLPALSRSLGDFLDLNKLDLTDDHGRMVLKEQLRITKDKAPIIHMVFAVEADPASLAQLVTYLRKEIHPQTLLNVGLQPALVGGAYIRTPNHIHDFSLRELLASKRNVITTSLEDAMAGAVQ